MVTRSHILKNLVHSQYQQLNKTQAKAMLVFVERKLYIRKLVIIIISSNQIVDVNGTYSTGMRDDLLNNSNARKGVDNSIHKNRSYKIKSKINPKKNTLQIKIRLARQT